MIECIVVLGPHSNESRAMNSPDLVSERGGDTKTLMVVELRYLVVHFARPDSMVVKIRDKNNERIIILCIVHIQAFQAKNVATFISRTLENCLYKINSTYNNEIIELIKSSYHGRLRRLGMYLESNYPQIQA